MVTGCNFFQHFPSHPIDKYIYTDTILYWHKHISIYMYIDILYINCMKLLLFLNKYIYIHLSIFAIGNPADFHPLTSPVSPGVMYPWCVCFVLSHLCLVGVLIFWDAIRSQSMLPATSMAQASHLMVQETWIVH
jgi:hypothetical protein